MFLSLLNSNSPFGEPAAVSMANSRAGRPALARTRVAPSTQAQGMLPPAWGSKYRAADVMSCSMSVHSMHDGLSRFQDQNASTSFWWQLTPRLFQLCLQFSLSLAGAPNFDHIHYSAAP